MCQTANNVCIYCLRGEGEVEFDREHIFPQYVGGTLFLDGTVCKPCNSRLGHQIDHELLRIPDVITAMDELGIPYDRSGVLRSYYDLELVSEKQRFRARFSDDRFLLLPQDLPDGSRISPEGEAMWTALKKSIERDENAAVKSLDSDEAALVLADLRERYDKAGVGEVIECPELDRTLVKRSEAFHGEITPKSTAQFERVVAKTIFEFLFFCFGKKWVDCTSWAEEIHGFAGWGCDAPSIYVFRSEAVDSTVRPIHFLGILVEEHLTRAVMGLFGKIELTLIAPKIDPTLLEGISDRLDDEDVVGVAFEQDLKDPKKKFFALNQDGTSRLIGQV